MGVREYVSGLEKLLIDACSQVQVQAKTTGCTGVWVNDAKIAALGIQVQRHRTMHGFALNCNTDLKWFEQFVACGLPNPTTSLSKEAGIDITVDQMAPIITRSFEKQFKIEARELSKIDPSLDYEIQSLL
ncbi:hypothetical protein EDD86DRAFT_211196 [Gorgonomyces haynaldii]|nr:hypothetical protein EDD86DRAFT_211196 [Gorgonomyces haynaldii]